MGAEGDDLLDEEDDDGGMILTHGGLHMGNVLVRDGLVTGIVDWGGAGYCIEEREHVEAKMRLNDSLWEQAIGAFVPPFPERFALGEHAMNEMRFYSGIREHIVNTHITLKWNMKK